MKGIREKLKSCKNVRNFLSNTRVIHKRFVLSFKIGNHSFQRDNDCLRIAMQMESPEEFILQGLFLCIVIH